MRLSGYGIGGPLEQAAGHDANYLAQAGVLHRNGNEAPVYFDPPVADTTGSLYAVIAILGALRGRDRNGSRMQSTSASPTWRSRCRSFQVADYGARGYSPGRNETYLNGGAAYYRIYATRDQRHVALGAIEEKFWRSFCESAGHPEWIGGKPSRCRNMR